MIIFLRYISHNVFVALFGAISVSAFYFVTANSFSDSQVREKISEMIKNDIATNINISKDIKNISINIDNFKSEKVGFDTTDSIIVYGAVVSEKDVLYKYVVILEQEDKSFIDSIVQRPGFYKISFSGYMPASYDEDLAISSIDYADMDEDSTKEFILNLKTTFADSVAKGFIILKRGRDDKWLPLLEPNMSALLDESINGIIPEYKNSNPVGEPIKMFGFSKDKKGSEKNQIKTAEKFYDKTLNKIDVYESPFEFIHGDKVNVSYLLRNGVNYKITKHPVKGHPIIFMLSFFHDDEAVMSDHYSIVTSLRVKDSEIKRDILWNVGFPMISMRPSSEKEINIDDMVQSGILAHTAGNMYFWHDHFERK